jgi:hypothetical protein
MLEYGLSGSATYSVELTGLDEMMRNIPNNDVNQISARNMRDIVYTLWLNGGGGSEFFYTQGPPLTEKSTAKVGGVLANRNFINVSLQELFDTMFFEAVPNEYSLTGPPTEFEFGFINPRMNLSVVLNQKNNTPFTSAIVTRTSIATGADLWNLTGNLTPNPTRPTGKGISETTPYNNTEVHQNYDTTWTLTGFEGGTKALVPQRVTVKWYFRRFWGYIDLSGFGSDFSTFRASPDQLKSINEAINNNYIKTSGQSKLRQIGTVAFDVPGLYHLWFAWPNTDYGGDGIPDINVGQNNPTGFKDGNGAPINFFRLVRDNNSPPDATRFFENQYGFNSKYNIYVSDFQAGSGNYTVIGADPTKG